MSLNVKLGWSSQQSVGDTIGELAGQIVQPEMSCVFLYAAPKYNPDELSDALAEHFSCPIVACSTAGEIVGNFGYMDGGIGAASLSSPELEMHQFAIEDVLSFDIDQAMAMKRSIDESQSLSKLNGKAKSFCVFLIDGLSLREEFTTSAVHGALEGIPLIGGSAGDGCKFEQTLVYANGKFRRRAASVNIFRTTLPFEPFKTQHIEPTPHRLVVTKAEAAKRRVIEINGMPAVEAYSQIIGVEPQKITPAVLATYPLLLKVGDDNYVRSIQKCNEDGSISLYCAIEDGLVLRIGQAGDIIANLKEQIDDLREKLPSVKIVLGFDCILRRLEILTNSLQEQAKETLDGANLIAFSTYGEQYNGLHVNQTLTGVAIGDNG